MTYQLGTMQWIQEYEAVDVGDDLLAAAADGAALKVEGHINDSGTWTKLRHQ